MKVLKFGGSVLKNADDVANIANIINRQTENNTAIVVVSAFYGITNKLLSLHKSVIQGDDCSSQYEEISHFHFEIIKQLGLDNDESLKDKILAIMEHLRQNIANNDVANVEANKDAVLSFGEKLSSVIICHYLHKIAKNNKIVEYLYSTDVIKTDDHFGHAIVDFATSVRLIKDEVLRLRADIVVCAGFIGSTFDGKTTTLGRNGSDYTASLFANAVNAEVLEIWKDTDGLFTADPKIVKNVKPIKQITYQEMAELSSLGNKVIHVGAIAPCITNKIPILLKNCYNLEAEGTLISSQEYNNYPINGIVKLDGVVVVMLSLNEFVNLTSVAISLQKLLGDYSDVIITISQNIKQRKIAILIEDSRLDEFIKNIKDCISAYDDNISLSVSERGSMITIIGANFSKMVGISGKLLNILGENNINIDAIHDDFSQTRISVLCATGDANKAVSLLHNAFVK